MIQIALKVFVVSVRLAIPETDVKIVIDKNYVGFYFFESNPFVSLVLSCLDSGQECINGGECIQRPLGDYICSCPYPYCGLRCEYERPFCSGTLRKIL